MGYGLLEFLHFLLDDAHPILALRVEIFVVLLSGQGLSILSEAYWEDKHKPDEELSFKKFLWLDSQKYKLIGSYYLILCMSFIFPPELFNKILSQEYQGIEVGFIPVFIIGFLADDFFFMLNKVARRFIKGKLLS